MQEDLRKEEKDIAARMQREAGLTGPPGKRGPPGVDGANGIDGRDGPQVRAGSDRPGSARVGPGRSVNGREVAARAGGARAEQSESVRVDRNNGPSRSESVRVGPSGLTDRPIRDKAGQPRFDHVASLDHFASFDHFASRI